jgi:rare lipoprotein A
MRVTVIPRLAVIGGLTALLAACAGGSGAVRGPIVTDPAPIVSGTMRPYQVRGRWYRPAEDPNYQERGLASWYGDQHHGRPTATGERFDMNALTAAHKTLPLPGLVEVTNLANGRQVVVRINDRGPFVDGRIIDLSRAAAEAIDLRRAGVGEVQVRYLGPAPRSGGGETVRQASLPPRRPTVEPGPRPYLAEVHIAPDAPAAANTPPVPSRAPATLAGVWVQAGVWGDLAEARRAAAHLGGSATVDQSEPGRFRVMVGPWRDGEAAERSRRAVISRGYPDATTISGG